MSADWALVCIRSQDVLEIKQHQLSACSVLFLIDRVPNPPVWLCELSLWVRILRFKPQGRDRPSWILVWLRSKDTLYLQLVWE